LPESLAAPLPAAVAPKRKGRGVTIAAVFLVLCAGVGVGGVLAWDRWMRDDEASASAPAPASGTDEATAPVAIDAAAKVVVAPVDAAAEVAIAPIDAGAAGVEVEPPPAVDAAVVQEPIATGAWLIDSTPAGARVYFDESEKGKTPLELPVSADKHTIAIVMPGYALYTAEVDGKGAHKATLTPVTPLEGPAGIKVKCKAKGRYYVFVDGKPTGQLCPTERIGVDLGEHTVEVYDLVTEERKSFPARVKETRNSLRVKVDEDAED
jgi:hypothetical protein